MATNAQIPEDPIDEELRRLLDDPEVVADLDAYLARKAAGTLEPGIPHEEVGRRLRLRADDKA